MTVSDSSANLARVRTLLVTPVVGHLRSKSVATLYPLDQQFLVKGPLVQVESATLVEVGVCVEIVARLSTALL